MEYSHFSKHILVASAIVLYQPDWPVENITGMMMMIRLECE